MSPARMTILAPEGMLGYGIPPRSMAEGMKRNPDALGVDAGPTDPGKSAVATERSDHVKVTQVLLILIEQFENTTAPMSKHIFTLRNQIKNLRRTRDLLLPRLFSGQVNLVCR